MHFVVFCGSVSLRLVHRNSHAELRGLRCRHVCSQRWQPDGMPCMHDVVPRRHVPHRHLHSHKHTELPRVLGRLVHADQWDADGLHRLYILL
jgi:hypothetical protein